MLETTDGPALFDCGPTSCLPALKERLAEQGLALTDLRHLLLSHIHLDHAGAAGVLVREHPDLQVHVSEIGAPHLADPSRLERSARRLYGDTFDTLWGELAPVPEAEPQRRRAASGRAGLLSHSGPRVAPRQLCRRRGDSLRGRRSRCADRSRAVRLPPTPPPDIDLEAWERTIDEIERHAAERLALIHFGVVESPRDHLRRLRRELRIWAQRVRQGMSEEEFTEAARADILEADGDESVPYYERAAPFWQSYAGLKRYWDKQLEPVSS